MSQPSVPPPSPYLPPVPIPAKVQPLSDQGVDSIPPGLMVVADIAPPMAIESNPLVIAPATVVGSEDIDLETAPRLDKFLTQPQAAQALDLPEAAITPPQHLRVQSRDGETVEFDITAPEADPDAEPDPEADPAEPSAPIPQTKPTPNPLDVVEINADRQDYDQVRQIVTATGNVIVRFARGVLTGDRIRVNLRNRVVVGDGDVVMRRGEQVFRGESFEYQMVQDQGVIYQARGEVNQRTSARDWELTRETAAQLADRPLSDRLVAQQPIQGVEPDDNFDFTVGGGGGGLIGAIPGVRGSVDRFRFEAERMEFDSQGWQAQNVRLTNDPFSPPELEIQAEQATFSALTPYSDELRIQKGRLVFDQGFSLPTFPNRVVFNRREETNQFGGLFNLGLDDSERGGLFIERQFALFDNGQFRWTVTPQYFVQRAIFDEGFVDPDSFGVRTTVTGQFDERTSVIGTAALTSLDFGKLDSRLRASVRAAHLIGPLERPHRLGLEYSYRDRLFNGSLGFQTVQSNVGLVITSPTYTLWDTGITLSYQGGIQTINADTDRPALIRPNRNNSRTILTRTQTAAFLGKAFPLWQGKALPATPDQGLRYTSRPVQPFVSLSTGLNGVSSFYSNGDRQQSLSGGITLQGQFGQFSRPMFDYTGFNIGYGQTVFGGQSPFLFDRIADAKTLSFGITQQIYGPFRVGIQSSINLDTSQEISTNYTIEYSRRTHSIAVIYNPVVGLGALTLRVGSFNWIGSGDPFGGSGVRPVTDGVVGD